jgi:hypothetical protein
MKLKGLARGLFICSIFVTASACGEYVTAPVTLDFPDFPLGVAVVDLGQTLTVKVDARNDGGQGVTWTCAGDACTRLTSTSRWATFHASGVTGTATITGTSIKQPSLSTSLKVTVCLNAVSNLLCGGDFLRTDVSAKA